MFSFLAISILMCYVIIFAVKQLNMLKPYFLMGSFKLLLNLHVVLRIQLPLLTIVSRIFSLIFTKARFLHAKFPTIFLSFILPELFRTKLKRNFCLLETSLLKTSPNLKPCFQVSTGILLLILMIHNYPIMYSLIFSIVCTSFTFL